MKPSVVRTAGANPSPLPRAARLLGELAAFALLLFVTRFLLRAHLIVQMDQECHIGGIATDVLAHGVRFPLLAYAPNDYDNGSFFSGLLAALSFALLGRNVLALKLVTHIICAAGAVAALWLLRGCLDELGISARRARWPAIAVLVIAIAVAPRVVTLASMFAVGNHAEGAAIDTILLALFARGARTRSVARTAVLWALAGFALYLNKATVLVLPAIGAMELALAWRARRRLLAAAAGLALGIAPELLVNLQRRGAGWAFMANKAELSAPDFPRAFLDSLWTLADFRIELVALWAAAVGTAMALLWRSMQRRTQSAGTVPVTLALVVTVVWLHLAELAVMAQGGLDAYAIYGYPLVSVLVAVLVARTCTHAEAAWGPSRAAAVGTAAVVMAAILYRPDALTWGAPKLAALWSDRAASACSWRFAEGFEREHDYGLTPADPTRETYAIERCRTLSDRAQVLDCIGGISRELHWRHSGRVAGAPPSELDPAEGRAYAYYYGTHRRGDATVCGDFTSPALQAECAAAVQLDCLIFGDAYTRFFTSRGIGRPHCDLPEPPMDGYWAAMRAELFARPNDGVPDVAGAAGWDADPAACGGVFQSCY